MNETDKIIGKLLELTKVMNNAIINRNIDVVEQTLKERQELLDQYNNMEQSLITEAQQIMINEMLNVDRENNMLLETLVEHSREKLQDANKEKSDVKKRTTVAKKYVAYGSDMTLQSKFNKKT